MFIGLSKTFAKFGKFRIGAGLRITKSNALWDVHCSVVRLDVPTVLVYDGSLLLADVCGLLWHLLVHQEVGHCSEREEIKVTGLQGYT